MVPYSKINSGDKPWQIKPLRLILAFLGAYSWFWSLSGTLDIHPLPPVLMLTMSAYQVFSDTHLTTPSRILKTLCGGFPLACRQWIKLNVSNRDETVVTPSLNMSACFCGIISDSGEARFPFGFNQNLMVIYSPNSGSTIANLVMIGKI